jgi:hypothetical protein
MEQFTMEDRLGMVRGAIIGALAGGHMEGREGYEYSKHILLQIADFLELTIPESVKDGSFRQNLPPLTIVPNEQDDLSLEQAEEDWSGGFGEQAYQDSLFLPSDPTLE